ncbi:MAG: glycosyltransferase family 9 protein [Lentisphaeria bacterium]|nr:glycosyltransferase family 9 protein [Lentisphaeria bacterium]
MRILVVKPSSFGDIVHLFPALALMREKYPDAELDFVVNPEFVPLLDYSPFPVRRKIIFERKKLGSAVGFFPALCRLCRELRREKYDIAVDFQGLFRSGLLLGLARAEVKAGFAAPREKSAAWFYNRKVAVPAGHAVERCGALAAEVFGLEGKLHQVALPLNPAAAAALPELPPRYAVLLPGTRWESKRFPPEFFGALAAALHRHDPDLAFVAAGSAAEREIAGAIGENVINLAGQTTLGGLFELLRNAEFVCGNDSGPLHAAAALAKPVFGFYGPTDPVLTGPWGELAGTFAAGCECAGCLKRLCPDGSYRCWQLDAEKVAAAIMEKTGGGK